VLDLYSRKVVGWSMGERMPTSLVCDALRMALFPAARSKKPRIAGLFLASLETTPLIICRGCLSSGRPVKDPAGQLPFLPLFRPRYYPPHRRGACMRSVMGITESSPYPHDVAPLRRS
jgi:hypothetical protein